MAKLSDLLALIPEGPEFEVLRGTLSVIDSEFSSELPEITASRLSGWVNSIKSGDREIGDLRKDIFKHVVGSDVIKSTFGVDDATAESLISGKTTFSDFLQGGDAGGGVKTKPGAPAGEGGSTKGVGGKGTDEETRLTILASKSMSWKYDKGTGRWYVGYKMPNSEHEMLFQATPQQMNALFGTGQRPTEYARIDFASYTKKNGVTFGGDITEVSGKGTWEAEVARVTALALDDGRLPDWAKNDPGVMDLVAIAELEEKDDEWLYEQLSKRQSFKDRFVGLSKFQKENNLTLVEAVQGFLEFESGVRNVLKQSNIKADVTPEVVGALLNRGYSLKFVQESATTMDRYNQNKDAFASFNEVLKARGQKPLTSTKEIFDFMRGKAPTTMYQVYEESALREAAVGAGIGDAFSARDAIQAAKHNLGVVGIEQATQQMQQAAQLLLRFRGDLNVGNYGLDQEDLIDISLGIAPRSGTPEAEIRNALSSAVAGAEAFVNSSSAAPYVGFGADGTPRAQSLSRSRTQY